MADMAIYAVRDVAGLGIDRNAVYRDIRTGFLAASLAGKGKFRAHPEDYEAWMARRLSGMYHLPPGVCTVCNRPMGRSKYGICTRTAECRRARSLVQEQQRKDQRRAYRVNNREKLRAKTNAYLATEIGLACRLITGCRVRAKARGTMCTIKKEDFVPAIRIGRCQHPACGKRLRQAHEGHGARPDSFTIDEIIPGRGYVPGNWALLCRECNTKKNNSSLPWLQATVEMMASALIGDWPPPVLTEERAA